jgi:hypothetical protein
MMVNADLGICVVASCWDTREAMTWSEQAIHVLRKQVVERLKGTATEVIGEFRDTGVPALLGTPAVCRAHILTDRVSGRCIVAAAWENIDAMGASRSATARLRANMAVATHMQVRSVEEDKMVFSSVRDGIALEVGVWVTTPAGDGYGPGGQWKLPNKVTY